MLAPTILKLQSLNLEREALKAIHQRASEVLDLNISQLMAGKTAADTPILPPYTERTVMYKMAAGQPYDRVTLRDTGAFQQGFYLEDSSFPIHVRSADLKEGKLVEKYGDNIFGLTKKSLEEVASDIVLPELKSAILKAVQL